MKRAHRNPELAAARLQLRNRILRWSSSPARTLAIVVLSSACLVVVLTLLRQAAHIGGWLPALEAHWPMPLAIATLYAAAATSRIRRRFAAIERRSWLGAAPLSPAVIRLNRLVRVALPLLAQLAGASLIFIWCSAGEARVAPMRAIASLWAGAACGVLLSLMWSLRAGRERYEDSRYARRARTASLGASVAPLSQWPMAQAFAWGRPENLRALVVICLLLGVQAGTSALHGLLIVAVWLASAYLAGLLLAVPRAARTASAWLRSTPLEFGRFAWAIARRALLHQAVGAGVMAVGLSAMGAPPRMALYLAALWLAIVALVYAVAIAAAYKGESPTIKLALSFASMAAIESRLHAWSVPVALLFAAWTVRRAHR